MTVVLESYRDACGVRADIEQDKYCPTFRLDVYEIRSGVALTVCRREGYMSLGSARRAMRRLLTAPVTCTYDRRKES